MPCKHFSPGEISPARHCPACRLHMLTGLQLTHVQRQSIFSPSNIHTNGVILSEDCHSSTNTML